MEYLVTMTTHVPDGTSEEAANDMRARESVRARELQAQGHMLRIWRPPLQPGEWRSLALFAADDADQLEDALASMPLRVWRSDEVTPLSPHPNNPGHPGEGEGEAEFLVKFKLSVPAGTPSETVKDTEAREAQRAKQLAEQGHLRRLWVLPAPGQTLGLWQPKDFGETERILLSLPLDPWMKYEVTPLTPHPSDPVAAH